MLATGKWGDKVKIYGFSIDNSAGPVKQRVTENGWTKPIQYHVRNGTCQADKQFKFQGIPFCVLLDTEGKVVFMGHPASRKFEDDFDTLLAGNKITGDGTTAAGGDDGDSSAGGKAMSAEDLANTITGFRSGVDAAKKEIGDAANQMMRAFFVLVQQSTFDRSSGSFKTDLKHYQVLVGPSAACDKLESAGKALRDNSAWEPILRK